MVQIQCTQARMCAQRSEIWERPRAKEKQERERAASGAILVGKDHEVTAAKLGRSIPSLTLGIKLRPFPFLLLFCPWPFPNLTSLRAHPRLRALDLNHEKQKTQRRTPLETAR